MRRKGAGPNAATARVVCAATLLLVALAACSSAHGSASASSTGSSPSTAASPASGTVLDAPVRADIASLPLVDQDGRTITLASLHGQTVVLADFLTLCQEICPLTSANLRTVDDAVRAAHLAGQVRVVEATVDPARDRPARLRAYQHLYGARSNWSFVTGTPAQIASLWKAFGVSYAKQAEPSGPPPKDWLTGRPLRYDVDHQDVVFVIGPDGHERWLVDGTPSVSAPSAVPSTLQSFLNDDGRANETAPPDPSWTPADVEAAIGYVTGIHVGAVG